MPRPAYPARPSIRITAHRAERGVVLIVALIAMVVMMAGATALIRSFDTSMRLAGQMAFKRDLMNQGERGLAAASAVLTSGSLNTETLRGSTLTSANYSSVPLASNSQGIPLALINDTTFGSFGVASRDIAGGTGVTIRYLIDRQCTATGAFSSATCAAYTAPNSSDPSGREGEKPAPESHAVYRISVRVSGPRNTTTFLQRLVSI